MTADDTIAAQATPAGRGGVGIIRVSGPHAVSIARAILGTVPQPRYARYQAFKDTQGQTIDMGLAIYFPSPHSFTGEDVLELHAHGGPVVMDLLLQAVLQQGARLARPGEFSERAFFNDKLDLVQAEAIADLIDASSEQAARTALRSMQGEFSKAINTLVLAITELRIYVEAAIDFPEEEIDFLAEGQVQQRIAGLQEILRDIQHKAQQGSVLREGIHIVLAGQPNAGKSSLLNALAGHEAAIVTPIAGTTRDVVREEILLDGLPVHIIDTAGLRASNDPVEQEGIRRTWGAIGTADCIVLLVDDTRGWCHDDERILQQLPAQLPRIIVYNKVDVTGKPAGQVHTATNITINLSAQQGRGIDALIDALKAQVGFVTAGSGTFMARRRHLTALSNASAQLQRAAEQTNNKRGELVAEELRQAQNQLSEITGTFTSDDLLGKIFASFCIGK
jgi:tRNA modification GTPase